MPEYIIEKAFEPTGIYAAQLEQLDGEEEELSFATPVIQKLREMTEEQAEMVRRRDHVIQVFPNIEVRTPPEPEMGADAAVATMQQVWKRHGFDVAHENGYKGQGRKVFVLDDGLAQAWAQKAGKRLIHKSSEIPDEDWTATDGDHGTWCFVWILLSAPEADMGFIKVLSNKTGSGAYSGIIRGINAAVAAGATEISESLGGNGRSGDPLDNAVRAARSMGVLMPCAAGNSQRGKTDFTADSHMPGASPAAICCAAEDINGGLAEFSSWGNSVDLRATGVNSQSGGNDGGLDSYKSGTSMATPVVSAACALTGSGKGRDAAARIEKAIYASCGDTALPAYQEGNGVLDVEFSTREMGAPVKPQPAPAPSTYYPNLSRMSKSKFNGTHLKEIDDIVITAYGIERGVYFRKGK